MKALVTGHCGLLGRHFTTALEAGGWDVDGCDIAGPHPRDARDLFRHAVRRYDLVVHCAAVSPHRAAIDKAPLSQAGNLELDAGLFQWAVRTRPGRVIYLSSSAVYPVSLQRIPGKLAENAIDLDDHVQRKPDGLYGWSKLTGEQMAVIARRCGIPVTVVRPFSGYAEDQSTDFPFGAFAVRARTRADPFLIWGDGAQVRDFVHADDIVAAALTLPDEPMNIGWGEPVTMLELAHMFARAAGYSPEFQMLTSEPSGVRYRVSDPARMRRYFEPKIGIREGVRRAVER